MFFGVVTYLFYRLGLEVSPHIFRIMFGKGSFPTFGKAKHLFSMCLATLFAGISSGSPPQLNLVSVPAFFPIALFFSINVGGLLFIYFLGKEMLNHSDLQRLTGPIPGFWRRVERKGVNDDYRKHWKSIQVMPSSSTKRLAKIIWIYGPASAILLLTLVIAGLLYAILFFSLVLDAILVVWLLATFLSKLELGFRRKRFDADTEKTLVQSIFSGYHPLGPKAIFVLLCLMSNAFAILISSSPFIIVALDLPSALGSLVRLGAMSFVLILFTPLMSYQLYFWWLLLKRSSAFLQAWRGQNLGSNKTKALPLWSIFLFSITWYPLIAQEFLLGHHFYPYKEILSLEFLISLDFNDIIAVIVFTLLSLIYWLGLIKLVKIRETAVQKSEILHNNILYGLISLTQWTSVALISTLTQEVFPRRPIILLFLTLTSIYLPDLARTVEQRFTEGSWTRRILFYGSPIAAIAFTFLLAWIFSIIDTLSIFISLAALVVLFLFFLWFDTKMTESDSKITTKSSKNNLKS